MNTTLEQQVCSLEYAKRLKELGVKQESLFYYVRDNMTVGELDIVPSVEFGDEVAEGRDEVFTSGCGCCSGSNTVIEIYSAFTVAELGLLLPRNITTNGKGTIADDGGSEKGDVPISKMMGGQLNSWVRVRTEADGRAEAIIRLLEQKLITL